MERHEVFTRTAALLIVSFFYLTGYLYHNYLVRSGAYPVEWARQAPVVLGIILIAFLCFAIAVLTRRKPLSYFLWAVLCILHVFVGYPSSEAILLRLLLFLSLIVLLAGCFETDIATVLAMATFGFFLWFERERYAWDELVPQVDTPILIAAGAVAIGVTICIFASRIAIDRIVFRTRVHKDLIASLSDLVSINLDLQEYALHAGEQSRAEERNRISRDIHDSIGYSLTTIMMLMEAGRDLVGKDTDRVRQFLDDGRRQAHEALQDTRASLHALRHYRERSVHGARALHRIIQTINNATNVALHVEYSNLPLEMSREAETFLGRFIQEGFTNAVRHGHATEIRLSFWYDHNGIRISMVDNGRGISGELSEGIGFQGMRERAQALGGWFTVASTGTGSGVRISALVPNDLVSGLSHEHGCGDDERR